MIIWKGIDLKTKGIINDTIPKIQKPKKRIDIYEIYGRNGFLSVDNDTYDSINMQIECHLPDDADMDEISTLLDGYGTISFDGSKQSTGIVSSNIEFDLIRNSGFKKFLLNLKINPIFEDIAETAESLSFTQVGDDYVSTIVEDFNYRVYPEEITISLTEDSDISFNGRTFSLKSGYYVLNCKMKEIVDNDGDNASGKMDGNFPYLDTTGTNEIKISSNPSIFIIKYKKTYLMG